MTTSEMIKRLCAEVGISISELSRRLGQSPQNFGKKLKRETVSLEELNEISKITGTEFEQRFRIDGNRYISTAGNSDDLRMENESQTANPVTDNDIKHTNYASDNVTEAVSFGSYNDTGAVNPVSNNGTRAVSFASNSGNAAVNPASNNGTAAVNFASGNAHETVNPVQGNAGDISTNENTDILESVLTNISHEIRTPLNTIVGFADMASNTGNSGQLFDDYMDKIKISAERITKLIDNMLEMVHYDRNEEQEEESIVDSNEAVNQFSEYLSFVAKRKNIHINYVLKGINDISFYCPYSGIKKMMLDIAGYAVRFTPKNEELDCMIEKNDLSDGRIEISCTFRNSVEIRDRKNMQLVRTILSSNDGIPDWTVLSDSQLELVVLRKHLSAIGGVLDMSSLQGEGTKMVCRFVFRKASDTNTTEEKEQTLEGRRILVVEDNALNREILKELLGIVGIITEMAEDGVDAVERVKKMGRDYYDAILMDIQMPRMNGYEATKVIREFCGDKRIPIIAVTANAFDEDRKKSITAGLDAHVSKPVDYNKLLILLKKYLLKR